MCTVMQQACAVRHPILSHFYYVNASLYMMSMLLLLCQSSHMFLNRLLTGSTCQTCFLGTRSQQTFTARGWIYWRKNLFIFTLHSTSLTTNNLTCKHVQVHDWKRISLKILKEEIQARPSSWSKKNNLENIKIKIPSTAKLMTGKRIIFKVLKEKQTKRTVH